MGGVLPRAVRAGQELDPDRQGRRAAASGAAARHAPARPVAVVTALRLPRRRRPGRRAISEAGGGGRRPGRPFDGRQDRDGCSRCVTPSRSSGCAWSTWLRWPIPAAASSWATSTRCAGSTSPRSPRGPTPMPPDRCGARTRPCAGSSCRTSAAAPTAKGGRWQPNLDVIEDDLDVISGWPADRAGRRRRRTTARCCGCAANGPSTSATSTARRWSAVPEGAPGDDQGRRALGALRAARGVPRGAAQFLGDERAQRARAAVGRDRVRLPQVVSRRARPVARQVEHDAVAVVVGADASRDISSARITSIIAIAVSTAIRSASGASSGRRRAGASRSGRAGPAGGRAWRSAEQVVDHRHGVVPVGGEQRAAARPQARVRRPARRVAVAAAGVLEARRRRRPGPPPSSGCPAPRRSSTSATAAWSDIWVSCAKTTLTYYTIRP